MNVLEVWISEMKFDDSIIKGFRTIVFIFIIIIISITFRPICPPAFFRCFSSSGTYTELRTTSFIESTLSIPVLLVACCQDWTCNVQMIVSLEAKFRVGSRVRQTSEEGRRTYQPKRCGNINKDEDNSPKTLNDKNVFDNNY